MKLKIQSHLPHFKFLLWRVATELDTVDKEYYCRYLRKFYNTGLIWRISLNISSVIDSWYPLSHIFLFLDGLFASVEHIHQGVSKKLHKGGTFLRSDMSEYVPTLSLPLINILTR